MSGPKAIASDYVTAEWQFAVTVRKAANPILREGDEPGDFSYVPRDLRLLDTRDFREDDDYDQQVDRLAEQLAKPVAPMGKLIGMPSLPAHFPSREEQLRGLKEAVMADFLTPVVVTGTAVRTGVHGMGGIGKSVLATAMA